MDELKQKITEFYELSVSDLKARGNLVRETLLEFMDGLEHGNIRCAFKANAKWQLNEWIKKGILLIFRFSSIALQGNAGIFEYSDKELLTLKKINLLADNIRMVPGGSSARRGSFLGKNCVIMPPAYINIGAFIDDNSMVDSHALVGSCAQIGKNVHLSAGVQIGGVLEPIGSCPVIIEDNAMVGGQAGIYEGVNVREGAVIGTGVILNRSTHLFDLARERIIKADEKGVLTVPEDAVVVMGARAIKTQFAEDHGLSLYAPIIIKYRDDNTKSRITLEEALR